MSVVLPERVGSETGGVSEPSSRHVKGDKRSDKLPSLPSTPVTIDRELLETILQDTTFYSENAGSMNEKGRISCASLICRTPSLVGRWKKARRRAKHVLVISDQTGFVEKIVSSDQKGRKRIRLWRAFTKKKRRELDTSESGGRERSASSREDAERKREIIEIEDDSSSGHEASCSSSPEIASIDSPLPSGGQSFSPARKNRVSRGEAKKPDPALRDHTQTGGKKSGPESIRCPRAGARASEMTSSESRGGRDRETRGSREHVANDTRSVRLSKPFTFLFDNPREEKTCSRRGCRTERRRVRCSNTFCMTGERWCSIDCMSLDEEHGYMCGPLEVRWFK